MEEGGKDSKLDEENREMDNKSASRDKESKDLEGKRSYAEAVVGPEDTLGTPEFFEAVSKFGERLILNIAINLSKKDLAELWSKYKNPKPVNVARDPKRVNGWALLFKPKDEQGVEQLKQSGEWITLGEKKARNLHFTIGGVTRGKAYEYLVDLQKENGDSLVWQKNDLFKDKLQEKGVKVIGISRDTICGIGTSILSVTAESEHEDKAITFKVDGISLTLEQKGKKLQRSRAAKLKKEEAAKRKQKDEESRKKDKKPCSGQPSSTLGDFLPAQNGPAHKPTQTEWKKVKGKSKGKNKGTLEAKDNELEISNPFDQLDGKSEEATKADKEGVTEEAAKDSKPTTLESPKQSESSKENLVPKAPTTVTANKQLAQPKSSTIAVPSTPLAKTGKSPLTTKGSGIKPGVNSTGKVNLATTQATTPLSSVKQGSKRMEYIAKVASTQQSDLRRSSRRAAKETSSSTAQKQSGLVQL